MIAATMLPAAPVMTKTVSGPSSMPAGVVPRATSRSATVQRRPAPWPTSTAPGSRRVSVHEQVGDGVGVRAVGEVDRLHQRVGVLALEGLGEAGHGATHRGRGTGGAVAMAGRRAGWPTARKVPEPPMASPRWRMVA